MPWWFHISTNCWEIAVIARSSWLTQNRSGWLASDAWTIVPFARTTVAPSTLSRVKPQKRLGKPNLSMGAQAFEFNIFFLTDLPSKAGVTTQANKGTSPMWNSSTSLIEESESYVP